MKTEENIRVYIFFKQKIEKMLIHDLRDEDLEIAVKVREIKIMNLCCHRYKHLFFYCSHKKNGKIGLNSVIFVGCQVLFSAFLFC